MLEIRFHGRGGQGAVVASEILAAALFLEGQWVQAFPAFGVERRGAPVTAFLRADAQPIRRRCQIYAPDQVVVLDPTLLTAVDVTAGLKANGLILINSEHQPHEYEFADRFHVATLDASAISVKHSLGTRTNPIVNTAMLGAWCGVTGLVQLNSIEMVIKEEGSVNNLEANVAAAREAYEVVTRALVQR